MYELKKPGEVRKSKVDTGTHVIKSQNEDDIKWRHAVRLIRLILQLLLITPFNTICDMALEPVIQCI